MKSGTTIFGICEYCGAPLTRYIPPSRKIPKIMYCNMEHMLAAMGGKPGTVISRACGYCGADVIRYVPPSKKIPEHLYCSQEHRIASIRRECGKETPRKYIPKYPELHDPEYLRNALDGRSLYQIAAEIGCGYDSVRKAALKYGIDWRRK